MTFPRKLYPENEDALRTRREQTTLDYGFATFVVPRKLTEADLDRLERWLGEILNDLSLRVESDVTPDIPPDAPRFQQPNAHVPLASQPKPEIPRR